MRTCFAALVLVSVFTAQPTGSVHPNAALHARGLQYGFNLDYPEALATFEQAIAADPHDAIALRLAAATLWTRLLFERGAVTIEDYLGQAQAKVAPTPVSPETVTRFNQYLDRALHLAEQQLREQPHSADAHFQFGAAAALRATFIATIEGRVAGSFGAARRAYHAHRRVLALDPQRKDAGLIVGMYQYTVASLPFHMKIVARLAGFESSRAAGLRLVEEAARHSGHAQTNARLTLVLMYSREKRHDDALRVIRQLQQLYPRNRLFRIEAASALLRAGRPADALREVDEAIAELARDRRTRANGEQARWQALRASAIAAVSRIHIGNR